MASRRCSTAPALSFTPASRWSRACLSTGAHYLDITGEIPVFEAILARGEAAREAGVALIPGVGFDVVPSDCLAARLARALPERSSSSLAFYPERAAAQPGDAEDDDREPPHAGAIRRDGRIVPVPIA